MMNNPYNIYNQNVPFINHTDWASVAKQWATLRADVNIPHSIPEHHSFHNIPPPPPPSPPIEHRMNFQSNMYDNYQMNNQHAKNQGINRGPPISSNFYDDYQDVNNQYSNSEGFLEPNNLTLPISTNPYDDYQHINDNHSNNQEFVDSYNNEITSNSDYNNPYQSSAFSVFEEKRSSAVKSTCETFDYNHGKRPYEYYSNIEPYKAPVTTSYTQNMWNLPPPDHPDIIRSNFKPEMYTQPEPNPLPKLFPIVNDYNIPTAIASVPPLIIYNKPPISKPIESKLYTESKFDNEFVATRPTKGLPAWIIDDMKKMKQKERKQPYHSMDIYKDNPVYSRLDEEGDVVMEDVIKETNNEIIKSGKNVSKHPLDSATTETDISDVSPHDEDPLSGKINCASKTLLELIDMFDEAEIEALKISIIRDSLTDVMKEITDDMIFSTVKSTFSRELSRGKKTHKHRGKSNAIDSQSKNPRTEVVSQLLGLDVYESEDEDDNVNEQIIKSEPVAVKLEESIRDQRCISSKSANIKEECDIRPTKVKSSNHKEKESVSSESSSKRKRRSKSKEKEKRKSHKKSKKHNDYSDHEKGISSWKKK